MRKQNLTCFCLFILYIALFQTLTYAGAPPTAEGHKFKSIHFFAAGANANNPSDRTYGTVFSSKSVRYIYGEVLYGNKQYRISETPFKITLSYRGEKDQPWGRVESMATPKIDWQDALFYHGVGWDASGYWQPGHYTVYVYFDEHLVGQGHFQVQP